MELFSPPSSKTRARERTDGRTPARTPKQQSLQSPNPFLKSPSARLLARTSPFNFSEAKPTSSHNYVPPSPTPMSARGSAPSVSAAPVQSTSTQHNASSASFAAAAARRRTTFASAANVALQQPMTGSSNRASMHTQFQAPQQSSVMQGRSNVRGGRVSTPHYSQLQPVGLKLSIPSSSTPSTVSEADEFDEGIEDDGDNDEHDIERWTNQNAVGARPSSASHAARRPVSASPAIKPSTPSAVRPNVSSYSSSSSLVPLPSPSRNRQHEYVPPREIFSRSDPLPLRQFQPAPPPSRAGPAAVVNSVRSRRAANVPELNGLGARLQHVAQAQRVYDAFPAAPDSARRSDASVDEGRSSGFDVDARVQRLDRSMSKAVSHGRRRFSAESGSLAYDELDYSSVQEPVAPVNRFENTEAFAAAAFDPEAGGMDAAELEAAMAFAEKLRIRREERLAREAREARMISSDRSRKSMLDVPVAQPSPLMSPSKRGSGDVSFFRAPMTEPTIVPSQPASRPSTAQRPSSAFRGGRSAAQ